MQQIVKKITIIDFFVSHLMIFNTDTRCVYRLTLSVGSRVLIELIMQLNYLLIIYLFANLFKSYESALCRFLTVNHRLPLVKQILIHLFSQYSVKLLFISRRILYSVYMIFVLVFAV